MSDASKFSRRQMLLGTALAGASAAAGGAAGADDAAPEAETDDPRRVILKDTPHTRAYYALARS